MKALKNDTTLKFSEHAPAIRALILICLSLICQSCAGTPQKGGGWFALRWMEKPAANGPSKLATPEDEVAFSQILSYDAKNDSDVFAEKVKQIVDGDVIAYRLSFWDAYREIIKGHINKIGYRMFKYGHLAIVVRDPRAPERTILFSSESFKGPNLDEGLDTLKKHDFDVYRLNKWDRVDRTRIDDFIKASIEKAGHWYGYDFMGMIGISNSNLRPTRPENIGHDYICSTVVVSALYYAGVELDAIQRNGVLDLVTPAQVVDSKGRFIPHPDMTLVSESPPSDGKSPGGDCIAQSEGSLSC